MMKEREKRGNIMKKILINSNKRKKKEKKRK